MADSRITSRSLAVLASRGMELDAIARLYEISMSSVEQAVDLERTFDRYQLAGA